MGFEKIYPPEGEYFINTSLVWWGTPGDCPNHGETLNHPGGIKSK